jgi:voltage-gated potassium channel
MILLSVLLAAVGTAGYMAIEGWGLLDSFYMTIITLASVGFMEVHQVSPPGRVFTVVLILLGVGFTLYVAGNVVQFLVEGRIREILGRRRLEKQIGRLANHYIVCGYGRIGRVLCRYLLHKYLDVVVIEKSEHRIKAMDEDGVLYLLASATDEETLVKAGIRRARGLFTALATDADNVFLVLTAKQHNPGLFVVARAEQNTTRKMLYAAGANKVISPYAIGARRMAHAVLRPTVIEFLELAFSDENTDIGVEEFVVQPDSGLVDKTLIESGIRRNLNLIILSIKKASGEMCFNPSADTRIEAGDTVIAVGEEKSMLKLFRLLRP